MTMNWQNSMAVEDAEGFLAACAAGGAAAPTVALEALRRVWPAEVDLIRVCRAANDLVMAAEAISGQPRLANLFSVDDDNVVYTSVCGTRVIPVMGGCGCYVSVDGDEVAADHYRYRAAEAPAARRWEAALRSREEAAAVAAILAVDRREVL